MANKGALTLASTYAFAASSSPYGAAVSPDSANLYVTLRDTSTLAQLAIGADGTPVAIAGKPTTVAITTQCRCVTVSPDGLNVYATSANGYFYTFSRAADGSLTMPVARISANVAYALGVAVSPDNAHIYVASYTGNSVRIYSRNLGANGAPTEIGSVTVPGARAVVVTPDGTGVYVSSDSGNPNYVYCFTRDPATGLLAAPTAPNDKIASPSNFGNAITCSDDGGFVFVANDSGNQYTGCYSRNPATNVLTDIGHHPAINGGIWAMALSRDSGNTSLYLAASDAQKVYQYDRSTSDLTNGGLTAKTPSFVGTSNYVSGTPAGSGGPYALVVTPNNKFMYATAIGTNSIDVFTIDQGVVATTPVYQDYVGTFDVLAPVYRDFTGAFDVRASVFRDFVGTFDVLAKVSRDFVGTFDVRRQVFRDFVGAFDVAGVAGPIDVSKISPARIVVFEGSGSRVVVFESSGPRVRFDLMSAIQPTKNGDKWTVPRDPDEKSHYAADITDELADRATTAVSVELVLVGVVQLELPQIQVATLAGVQRTFVVAFLGGTDTEPPDGWKWVARVTCANGERFDKTTWFNKVDP
jgi:6-phosphogluconolactonase (cycloisomerase 2 family)